MRATNSKTKDEENTWNEKAQPCTCRSAQQMPIVSGMISNSQADPFNVTTLAVDENAQDLLGFHLAWWKATASNWRAWHTVDQFEPAEAIITRKCFSDRLRMLTTITYTSILMDLLKFSASQPSPATALQLKTLKALREEIDTNRTQPIFLVENVSYLCLVSKYRKDWPAVRAHLRTIK